MNLLLEDKLLRYCAQIGLDENIKYSLEKLLNEDLNWQYIFQESISQGVASLLYYNLREFKDKIREDMNRFEQIYYANSLRNIQVYQEVKTIFSLFNKESIKLISLKGIFLAENIYDNIALRPIASDIDLLIKKEELTAIDTLLKGAGYSSPIHKKLRSFAIEKGYINSIDYFRDDLKFPTLHLHWHIVNVTLPTYMYTQKIKMERFWECARPTKLADTDTLELAPHHLIMYLAEHALKHSFDRLILLTDIDAVIKKYKDEINWNGLIKEAFEFGLERPLFYSLYFTNYFLDTEIPDYVLSKLKPKKISYFERLFFNSVVHNRRDSKLCYFVYLNMVEGLVNKSRFIFRTIFPPPSVLVLTFNLTKPKVTIKDYFSFLNKQFSRLKKSIFLKSEPS